MPNDFSLCFESDSFCLLSQVNCRTRLVTSRETIQICPRTFTHSTNLEMGNIVLADYDSTFLKWENLSSGDNLQTSSTLTWIEIESAPFSDI